jgi:uncharacterized membrane-anchored protein YitT (DUF2179 family)
MNHMNESVELHTHSHVCWSAILIGALVGVGLGFLLNLYGVAIGLSAYSSSTQGAHVVAVGGFIGMILGVIASMVAAGYTSGYLARGFCCHNHFGLIYGFSTWCAALILSALLVIPATNYVTSYTKALSRTTVSNTTDDNNAAHRMTVNDQETAPTKQVPPQSQEAKNLAWSAWMVFLLFFIGAISACVGASCGIGCHRKEHTDPVVTTRL